MKSQVVNFENGNMKATIVTTLRDDGMVEVRKFFVGGRIKSGILCELSRDAAKIFAGQILAAAELAELDFKKAS